MFTFFMSNDRVGQNFLACFKHWTFEWLASCTVFSERSMGVAGLTACWVLLYLAGQVHTCNEAVCASIVSKERTTQLVWENTSSSDSFFENTSSLKIPALWKLLAQKQSFVRSFECSNTSLAGASILGHIIRLNWLQSSLFPYRQKTEPLFSVQNINVIWTKKGLSCER